jgi:hypothetical protein
MAQPGRSGTCTAVDTAIESAVPRIDDTLHLERQDIAAQLMLDTLAQVLHSILFHSY